MTTVIRIIATGFGTGYSPWLPGTAGSTLAAVIAWFIPLNIWHIVFLCLAGIFICAKGEILLNEHDSPHIVFDEFCGIFIATWGLSSLPSFFLAFILFRFFDMVKPYPISKLQELPGGWGVMADDLAAGLIARFLVHLSIIFF
ncbi:phosphatidylglycerophosphatase A [Thermanaerosceptrum fracticalcis]|uniref:Phosphatidylglycerophosphatase A n=1 Tax=Thermanaerosceptrum fracticalcis TaxID=1712410 RepID=A0A7G6E0U6_THEFR|nr:phosphatidylglycerophosphatase A [Thermanaerosceptrum fracticalcis]QNB45700.1 phosphatidylglycerophosphatase A [Thermanaerosceptrum fracticalcis]